MGKCLRPVFGVFGSDRDQGLVARTIDLDGDLLRYTDADGRVTQYTYDDLNRETAEQWYASTSARTATDALSFGYDLAGNMYQASETNAQNSADNSAYWYQYDMPGNVTEIQAEVPDLPLGGRVTCTRRSTRTTT